MQGLDERIDNILKRATGEVRHFFSHVTPRQFAKVDEALTTCLLQLDEIQIHNSSERQKRKQAVEQVHDLINQCTTQVITVRQIRGLILNLWRYVVFLLKWAIIKTILHRIFILQRSAGRTIKLMFLLYKFMKGYDQA